MNLGAAYRAQFQKGFKSFSDAWFAVDYRSVTSQSVTDRETGVVTPGTEVARPEFHMVRDKEKIVKLLGITVKENETGVIFPALDLTDGVNLVEPQVGDYYIDPDGISWEIMGRYPDNFRAMWLLHVVREQ